MGQPVMTVEEPRVEAPALPGRFRPATQDEERDEAEDNVRANCRVAAQFLM
ncbi:hypothetical protein [Streptacidiphilus melanogenes]|uniref:hypothetical protein n=1 Tax=Streptacidiphilus melanogenes TaxID=411235 RepID=UPI001364D853|nr:hypothetical protein [Streptacidiphilus melanogenes]